jgi:plasmid maintenance system antidote protein VapI
MFDERPSKIGMPPPHPGDLIRTEILDDLHLSVARVAEILGVRHATLSELIRRARG